MSSARLLVIEHQGNAGLNFLSAPLERAGLVIDTVGPDTGVSLPQSLDGYDALIVLGGAMGPTDDEEAPWLPQTRRLMAAAVERRVPTLGICLGGQLLATAVGGRVDARPEGPEVGLCRVEFNEEARDDLLFGDLAESNVPVVQWHYLEVTELPQQARLLGSNAVCANQAFRVGDRAWGVQFHPEALTDTVVEWVDEDPDGPSAAGLETDSVLAEVQAAEDELRALWAGITARFAELTKGRAAA